MGLHGNIVIYPAATTATPSPVDTVKGILAAFVSCGLVGSRAAEIEPVADDCSATFAAQVEEAGRLSTQEYAYACVGPEHLTKALGALVYILDVDEEGRAGPIELPFLEVSAFSKPTPLVDPMLDTVVGEVCAAIEFSYEDARLSEEVHMLRDERHPVLVALSEFLNAELKWTVIAG